MTPAFRPGPCLQTAGNCARQKAWHTCELCRLLFSEPPRDLGVMRWSHGACAPLRVWIRGSVPAVTEAVERADSPCKEYVFLPPKG